MLDDYHSAFVHSVPGVRGAPHWKRDLRHTLHDRARETVEAIEHATGVYFPDRVHEARIAIKKLRYAMEIAHETGAADRSAAIKELKKAQDVLGELHDRQELVDDLTDAPVDEPAADSQVSLVKQVLDAECNELHGRYLSRRQELKDICRQEWTASQRHPRRALVVAGTLALSSQLYSRLR